MLWVGLVVLLVLGVVLVISGLRRRPPAGQKAAKTQAPAKPKPPEDGVRPAIAAGQYYPDDPVALRHQIQSMVSNQSEKVSGVACMVPHDAYVFSGRVAGAVLGRLNLPRRFVILSPAHTGKGPQLGMMSKGVWRTPLGDAPVDRELAHTLGAWYRALREDDSVHRIEHSTEVLLPFLQVLRPDFTFVPISVTLGSYEALAELGQAIGTVIRRWSEPVMIVGSTDLNHYESAAMSREKDEKVIERIVALDSQGILDTIGAYKVTMCGYGAAVAMTSAAVWLGAQKGELVQYTTTAETTGNPEAVIGYAGIILY